ncbi:MAG: ECF transporter S component [Metamycoplasmataceae bacterium]
MNKWTPKKMAFVSILIATSIAFVVIGAQLAAVSAIPSIKLSLAGLPVKISGYLFGPLVGFIVGFFTDILTFLYIPTFYYPLYSIALGISGLIPGIFYWFYIKKYDNKLSNENQIKKLELRYIQFYHILVINYLEDLNSSKAIRLQKKMKKNQDNVMKIKGSKKNNKCLNFNLTTGVIFSVFLWLCCFIFIFFIPQEHLTSEFGNHKFFSFLAQKEYFHLFIGISFIIVIAFFVITRFTFSEKTYLKMVPIFVFVLFTEFINLPVVALADQESLDINFMVSLVASLATSPIKIWFNLLIISFATKIIVPLIINKESNSF